MNEAVSLINLNIVKIIVNNKVFIENVLKFCFNNKIFIICVTYLEISEKIKLYLLFLKVAFKITALQITFIYL